MDGTRYCGCLGALALMLAGCTPASIAGRMDTHPPVGAFSFSDKAVVFIDADRRGENLLFHRRFDQVLVFQNTDLLAHPRLTAIGTAVPDVFQVTTGRWLYSVVEPGDYTLVVIQDANQTPPENYRFSLVRSPLHFSVRAGEMVDLGHAIFHNDDTDECAACDAVISTRVRPHDDEERAAFLKEWRKKMPGLPAPLKVRLAEFSISPIPMRNEGTGGQSHLSQ